MKLLSFFMLTLVFVGCGNLNSVGTKHQGEGIHSKKTVVPRSFKNAKSPNGFHPAKVNPEVAARAAGYKKDKHGMPTYPDKVRTRVVRTTAYSHMEMEKGAPWKKNALGTILKYGKIRSAAADWSKYPVGTKFKIKGLPHTYVVDDYGSALVGTNTVDIYHPTLRSMRRWGTRKVELTVIEWGSWEKTLKILKGRTKYRHTRKMYYAARSKTGGKL